MERPWPASAPDDPVEHGFITGGSDGTKVHINGKREAHPRTFGSRRISKFASAVFELFRMLLATP
jgi:hypothetical protein